MINGYTFTLSAKRRFCDAFTNAFDGDGNVVDSKSRKTSKPNSRRLWNGPGNSLNNTTQSLRILIRSV
jgi:hypothetical protein